MEPSMTEKEKIGARIVELRKEKGITQVALAEATGIDRGNISKLESGQYNASIDILSKISDALECKIALITPMEYEDLANVWLIKKAKAVFEHNNAENDSIKLFGDWAVNEAGDIANYQKNYPLYSYWLEESKIKGVSAIDYWTAHVERKYGFDVEHFKEAYNYAMSIAKAQD